MHSFVCFVAFVLELARIQESTLRRNRKLKDKSTHIKSNIVMTFIYLRLLRIIETLIILNLNDPKLFDMREAEHAQACMQHGTYLM